MSAGMAHAVLARVSGFLQPTGTESARFDGADSEQFSDSPIGVELRFQDDGVRGWLWCVRPACLSTQAGGGSPAKRDDRSPLQDAGRNGKRFPTRQSPALSRWMCV